MKISSIINFYVFLKNKKKRAIFNMIIMTRFMCVTRFKLHHILKKYIKLPKIIKIIHYIFYIILNAMILHSADVNDLNRNRKKCFLKYLLAINLPKMKFIK